MKLKLFLLTGIVLFALPAFSQDCYEGWEQYTTDEYVYSAQHDVNRKGLPETSFLNGLLRDARNELARQFEVGVKNDARLDKTAINGRTSTTFVSLTEFSTDVTLKLCEVKSHYEAGTGEGYAIAYINKKRALDYYRNEFELAMGKIDNAVANARGLIEAGSKIKARDEELTPALRQFDKAGDALAWMGFFDIPDYRLSSMMDRCYASEQQVKRLLSGLSHATSVYIQCSADMFGTAYPLATEIRGRLNGLGCQYVSDKSQADWVIAASGRAEKFSETPFRAYGGESKMMYVVDAFVELAIKNALTGEIIYNSRVEAADRGKDSDMKKAARQAYASVVSQIETILKEELSR